MIAGHINSHGRASAPPSLFGGDFVKSGTVILNRLGRPAIAGAIAFLAIGCVPPENPAPTTTAPTSTTSTIPSPTCDDYTPTGLTVSNPSPSAGDTIVVSGNGAGGSTIALTLVQVSSGTVVNTGVSTTVGGGGTWSANLTLPNFLSFGEWDVVATADGNCAASARIEII
jgi:hypothetical protein